MTFTDDDLKRLKEYCSQEWPTQVPMPIGEAKALLARLEAAETYARFMRDTHNKGWFIPEYKAWRKAAGK